MNILKVQTDFLKRICRGERVMFTEEYEGKVGVSDGYAIYLIDKQRFFLREDSEHLHSSIKMEMFTKYLSQANLSKRDPYDRLQVLKKPKIAFANFYTESESVYVDTKLINYFDNNAKYHIVDKKKPVFVYESGELVGIVMPCTINVLEKKEGTTK